MNKVLFIVMVIFIASSCTKKKVVVKEPEFEEVKIRDIASNRKIIENDDDFDEIKAIEGFEHDDHSSMKDDISEKELEKINDKEEKMEKGNGNELNSKGFIDENYDIPLLVAMEKLSKDNVGFDSASGSILSIAYVTDLEVEKVRDFYLKTLPQMGWFLKANNMKKSILKRENEKLEIEFSTQGGRNVVRFFIFSSF